MDFTHTITLPWAWFDKAEGESIQITYTFESVLASVQSQQAEALDFQFISLIELSEVYTDKQTDLLSR
jgi:hypothetical protein